MTDLPAGLRVGYRHRFEVDGRLGDIWEGKFTVVYFGLFPLMRWLSAKDYEIQEAARVVEVDPPHLPIARNQFHPAPVPPPDYKPPRPALPSSDSRTRISREDLDALLNENVRLRLALAQRLAQDNNNTEIEVA
jgi:hypothetical protein